MIAPATTASDRPALAVDTARVFADAAGERVLAHLRQMTRERVLGPEASDALLRHVEGQRALVAHIESLIERGRRPAPPRVPTEGDNAHD